MVESTFLTLKGLFKKISELIRNFVNELDSTITEDESIASLNEIRNLIHDIKERTPSDEKERDENKEILNLLFQISKERSLFSLIKLETEEWEELLDTIEKRIEMGKTNLTEEEIKEYDKIKSLTNELRGALH